MRFPTPLTPGRLVRRYKRFLADVTLAGGETVTVHCANPGAMLGLAEPGMEVFLSRSDNPARKLPWSWELVRVGPGLVGINTAHPNRLVEEAILAGRSCRLNLGHPLIMGILNVTPDSFSDGGRFADAETALRRGLEMAAEGADLIDIGGESTRPGAPAVALQEELDRVLPVVEALRRESDIPLSIDTNKATVATAAIAAGAEFINDISGLQFDPKMAAAVADGGAGLFVMHTRGRPEQMQKDTDYPDLLSAVVEGLRNSLTAAIDAGVAEEKLAVDPGIGFGKSAEGNLELLQRLGELHSLGRPVLLGTSRKGFIGRVTGRSEPTERLYGTLATVALGVQQGVQLFRVHDVGPARDAARMAWAIRCAAMPQCD